MDNEKLLIEAFVEAQVQTWGIRSSKNAIKTQFPVITVCMEPGSGGSVVAQEIARQLDYDFFHRDIINEIAKSSKCTSQLIETIEKDRLFGMNDFISSLINDEYLWPGLYLEHLIKVVSVIGQHGRAVIVGRGANFILPIKERYSIRVVAALDVRIQNIASEYGVSLNDAKKRILKRESRREAFVKHSFDAKLGDPHNYDLIINTEKLSIKSAVNAVIGAIE